ncbi:MAG: hypothetical protein SPI25_00040 [Dialister sp.]|nr:hypothetical protein [Dialister sp.]
MKWKVMVTGVLAAAGFACEAMGAGAVSPDMYFHELPLTQVQTEGTLIFSDSPEYVSVPGILAEGTVQKGKGRIYYYHVNEIGKKARLVVYGTSDKAAKVTLRGFMRGKPSRDYISTGASLSFQEATVKAGTPLSISISEGKKIILAEDDETGIDTDDLVSGYVDVETTSPVRFGVAMLPYTGEKELIKALERAEPLPPDSAALRGTFPMEAWYEAGHFDASLGPAEIKIGDGVRNPFFTGRDEMNFITRENTGNYGITYHITVPSRGKGTYRLYINPQGGNFPATLRIGQHERLKNIYRTDRGKRGKHFGYRTDQDVMDLGTWETGRDLFIRLVIPGAAYLPVRFLFVPVVSA